MSVPRVIEMVFSEDSFTQTPAPGDFYRSQSGLTAMAVSKVRKVIGDRAGLRYRLIGLRVRLCDLPAGAALLPWPKRLKLPSRAAMEVFGPPPPPPKRMGLAVKRTEERRRAIALLRDDRDSNRVVHKVRIDNNTAVSAEWKDNEDLNPNRRVARVIHGYRSRDSIQVLLDNGTINRGHASAGKRFRKEWELGSVGLRPARDLSAAPNGFASGVGPSENRSKALEAWNATTKALMPHLLEVLMAVVIAEETMLSYSDRKKMNRMAVSGYVLAALDALRDVYSLRDKNTERDRRVESIGARLGFD